eukprot:COSAG03_NODE_135_length_11863_cov_11.909470_5_plen_81_part_00
MYASDVVHFGGDFSARRNERALSQLLQPRSILAVLAHPSPPVLEQSLRPQWHVKRPLPLRCFQRDRIIPAGHQRKPWLIA